MAEKESKLASFWNTPFTKFCFGMSHNGDRRWLNLNYNASSLYNVFADGVYKPTYAGRHAWKSLIADSSLQYNCNKEGFNVLINKDGFKIRVALVANDESDCDSCNSWLGCGCTNGEFGGICANWALARVADNGGKDITAFGYLFVQ